MRRAAVGGRASGRLHRAEPHLGQSRVDLQDLLVAFDLAHADFAGELRGGGAVSLQREGTVQGLLVAAPHLGEGELLEGAEERTSETSHRTSLQPTKLTVTEKK